MITTSFRYIYLAFELFSYDIFLPFLFTIFVFELYERTISICHYHLRLIEFKNDLS